jgi:flavin-dependent dehydrogenase
MRSILPAQTDVAIIGAGPAGSAAALALARLGVSVVMIEAGRPRPPVGETLPPSVRAVLDRLDLRATVEAEGYLPSVGSYAAWGEAEPWGRDFLFNRYGHGWHIDRRRFDALLRETARAAGVQLVFGRAVTDSKPLTGGGFRLELAGGANIVARAVLDASGRVAVFARQRGVVRHGIDRMVAIIGYVLRRPDADPEPAATLVEATETGWWYSAPVPQDRLAVAFMTDSDLSRATANSPQAWLERLTLAPHTAARVANYGIGLAGFPVVVAAASGRLARFGEADWLAIGDAAATQDPLSSEGILVAMDSGIEAATAAARMLGGDRTAFSMAKARREQRWLDYLGEREKYYAAERRWCDAPFWRRRHAASIVNPGEQQRTVA